MRRQITKALSWFSAAAIAIGLLAGLTQTAIAQGQGRAAQAAEGEAQTSAPTIDAATGKILNEAIELLNMENYSGANQKIATLNLQSSARMSAARSNRFFSVFPMRRRSTTRRVLTSRRPSMRAA